jgi:hypothetical protein
MTKLAAVAVALSIAFAPAAFAADQKAPAPKTKAECAKHKDMKWDEADKKCVPVEKK